MDDGPAESFIVRIYRRDARRSTSVHGIVEQVGTNSQRRFSSMRELVAALSTPQEPRRDDPGPPSRAPVRERRTKT
jgi:hypothetical protein